MTFKGQLADGHIHLTAEELFYHRQREHHEKQKRMLRKYANNPALSDELRRTLNDQVYYIELLEWYQQRAMIERSKS